MRKQEVGSCYSPTSSARSLDPDFDQTTKQRSSVLVTVSDSYERHQDIDNRSLMDSVSLNWKGSSLLEMNPFMMDSNAKSCRLASKR